MMQTESVTSPAKPFAEPSQYVAHVHAVVLPSEPGVQARRGFGLVWCNLGGATADIGWALEEELGFWGGQGDPLVRDFGSGGIFRDSAGTASGMAYVFLSGTGTFEHVSY